MRDHANGWCCADCLQLLANAETPPELSTKETTDYLYSVSATMAAGEVTLGRVFGEDGCAHTADAWHSGDNTAEEHATECETRTFSMRRCDVCGSPLGGSRHAVTFWQ